MSKKKSNANRKCSAMLAAGAGAAICLTGGNEVLATAGSVAGSNFGVSVFGTTSTAVPNIVTFDLFGGAVGVRLLYISGPYPGFISLTVGAALFKTSLGVILHFGAGVSVSSGLNMNFSFGDVRASQSNNYIPMQFGSVGTEFGWVHVVSTSANAREIRLDFWSFNAGGGSIKTLSESVTTSRLALTDGKEKLHWTNENEDGVARYEVQSKDASGEWVAADSDVPGDGSYSAKVAAGATSRLVVEMTDGTTKEIDF